MRIIDTNILSKFVGGEIITDFSGEVYTTYDLKGEIEMLKSSFPNHKTKLQKVKFIEIEKHHYFDEARYLFNYKNLINKHTKITSFYGLKGMGDISILASVATILGHTTPTLFDSLERIEVVSNDQDLKDALSEEFGTQIDVSDPLHPLT